MGIFCSEEEKVEPEKDEGGENTGEVSSKYENPRRLPRSTTDVFFIIAMALFLIIFCFLLIYCIVYGDIFRIINGYDNCGNICGVNGISFKGNGSSNCSESNELKPFHLVMKRNNSNIKERFCVKDCKQFEGYRKFLNRCIPSATHKSVNKFFSKAGISNFFQEVSEDIHLCYMDIINLCLISLVFSFLLLLAFRYLVGFVIWFILFGVIIACCTATTWLWIMWHNKKLVQEDFRPEAIPLVEYRTRDSYLAFSIASSVITVAVMLVIFVLRKRIEIVVQLFKESGKALAAIPLLLFMPILTFISIGSIISCWILSTLWIESAGRLVEKTEGIFHYDKDEWMRITRWLNLFAMLWQTQFVIGCQHMIIAGAVSTWYFTRDKSRLNSPLSHSFYNLVRYHLGSVALGSLIIAIVQFLRLILKFIEKNFRGREGSCAKCVLRCCQCCLYCFERILKYLTRNAYIEVAMYGYSFCKGGRQAFRLLVANALRVTAINSVGDFTLFLGKMIVVIATVFIGIKVLEHKEGIQHIWVPITLAAIFAYLIAHAFMTVYEMIIDTIFLCFCEDCEKNDGVDRPYYMSRGLMSFVENSKKAIELHDKRRYRASKTTEVSPGKNIETERMNDEEQKI